MSAQPAAVEGLASLRQQADAWWRSRARRERQAVVLVFVFLVAVLVWAWFIAPAWATLRSAPQQLDALDAQLQQMQSAAAESRALRGTTPVPPTEAAAALKAATDRLGEKARLNMQGDRAILTLTGVTPEALRAWLGEARAGARARPIEAQLQRGPAGFTGSLTVAIGGAS